MASPADVSGLLRWYKVSSITGLVDGDPISSLPDSSGNAVAATQATSGAQPTYKTNIINGKPVARFDGVNDYLSAAVSITGTSQATVVVIGVMRDPTGTSTAARYIALTGAPTFTADWDTPVTAIIYRASGSNWRVFRSTFDLANVTLTTGSAFATIATWNGTAGSAYLNGTGGTTLGTTTSGNFGVTTLQIGAGYTAGAVSDWAAIDVAEVMVFAREITSGERATIDTYAQDTYGITVSDYVGPVVSYVASSAAVAVSALNGTSVAPAYPAGMADGDCAVMFVAQKPTSGATTTTGATVTTPSGWTALGSFGSSVTTAVANDVGPTKISVFKREVAATDSSATVTVTIAGNDVAWAHISVYHRAMGTSGQWDVAFAAGEKTTGGASYTATASTNPGAITGDHFLGALSIPTDVTTPAQFTAEALTATGATFAAVTEIVEPDTTTGTDMGGVIWRTSCTAGTATAAPVFTTTAATTNTNVYGPTVMVRLREIAAATSVENTVATSWAVAANVTATKASAWNVAAVVTASKATAWNVTTPVAATVATAWDVRSAVAATAATAWETRAVVTSTAATAWGVAGTVTSTVATAWNVTTAVTASSATSWAVRSVAASTVAQSWAVASTVTASTATAWGVGGTVTSSKAAAWGVATGVTSTAATSWAVNVPVAASQATSWAVLAPVTATAATGWGIAAGVTATVATAWAVRAAVTASAATAWAVAGAPGVVSATAATSWAVNATTTSTTATAWGVLTGVTATAGTAWGVLATTTATVPTAWDVRAPVATSTATSWAIASIVDASHATAWDVHAPVAASVTTGWAVAEHLVPVVATMPTEWAALQAVTADAPASWALFTAVGAATVTTTWAVDAGLTVEGSFTATLTAPAWTATLTVPPAWSASLALQSWTATLEDA